MADGTISSPKSLTPITLAIANTEYALVIPAGISRMELRARSTTATLRYAFVTGKVAGPTDPYHTLYPQEMFYEENMVRLQSLTIYLASPDAGTVVEVLVWN